MFAGLAVVDHAMPPDLQAQDKRAMAAKDLLGLFKHTR
jgi:hypothetical protein